VSEFDPGMQRWLAILVAAAAGLAVGTLAFRWKRRNSAIWMIYGAVTFGAAALVLAFLPRLERRHLSPRREDQANWHG
jgi:MFS family permease